MKTLISLFLILSVSSAIAQGVKLNSQKCSNSDGSVAWERDLDDSEVRLKYSNFIEGVLVLDINDLNIIHNETKILDDKITKNCAQEYARKVSASKIIIAPGDKSPYVLISHFPENKIYTEVICTEVTLRDIDCKRK